MSEEEVNFFLGGHEQFDMDTFKSTGFTLLKPYLELEQQSSESEPEPAPVDSETAESDEPAPVPSSEDPQVYDPWRANQAKEEEVLIIKNLKILLTQTSSFFFTK